MPAQAPRVRAKGASRPCKPAADARGAGSASAPPAEAADHDPRHELAALVEYIRAAKTEIAALRPDGLRERHIRPAADELDAIVAHTEEATGAILEAAEGIEQTARAQAAPGGETIVAQVTRIYEACNFQDITGQRVTKVVAALRHIEESVGALAAAFGALPAMEVRGAAPRGSAPGAGSRKSAGAGADESRLLNGPQLPAAANSQEDVDALLNDSG